MAWRLRWRHTEDLNLYAYVSNDPINRTDPTGETPMHVAGGIIGGAGGLLWQAGSDLLRWQLSSAGDYAGSVVGGAVGGVAAITCGPMCVGTAAGAASSITRQVVNGGGFDYTALARDTAFGAISGGVAAKLVPVVGKTSLTRQQKGQLGEGMTELGLKATGQQIAGRNVPNDVGKSNFDFQLTTGKFVESKFGTATLSSKQKEAARILGDGVDVQTCDYGRLSGMVGAMSGSAGAGK